MPVMDETPNANSTNYYLHIYNLCYSGKTYEFRLVFMSNQTRLIFTQEQVAVKQ